MIRRLLLLGALALGVGVAVRLSTAPAPAVATGRGGAYALSGGSSAQAEPTPTGLGARPYWQLLWTRPTPGLVAMNIAPGGQQVAWVDRTGSVRLMDETGRTRWQTRRGLAAPGVNRLMAAPGGAVLAYSHLNPAAPSLHVFHGPKSVQRHSLDGAIWNAAVSTVGDRALVGTGRRSLYLFSLANTDAKKAATQWRAPGIPDSLALLTNRSPLALSGTWQETGVAAYSLDGTPRWRHDAPDEPSRSYAVALSGDGRTAVAVSCEGPREATPASRSGRRTAARWSFPSTLPTPFIRAP